MHETLKSGRIYVAVDLMFTAVADRRLKLLLSRRVSSPCEGLWALPGSFIGADESADDAVRRLKDEMLPGTNAYHEQLYTFSAVNRDARGRVITIAYVVALPGKKLERLPDATRMEEFDLALDDGRPVVREKNGRALDKSEIAFDHLDIIWTGIRRLRGKLDYTDIGLRFVNDPKRFTMVELEGVFEAIMGQKPDSSNFRRFIRNRFEDRHEIVPVSKLDTRGRGRPAIVYEWIKA